MIIQALDDYYKLIKDDPRENIPLRGFSREKVHFEFELNVAGKLLQIHDLRSEKKTARSIIMPEAVKRASNIAANFLCDNTAYVLGRDNKEKEKDANDPTRGNKTFESFKRLHHDIGDGVEDPGMKAVLKFIESWDPSKLEESLCWKAWEDLGGAKVVFRLEGEHRYIHERPMVKKAWLDYYTKKQSNYSAYCLVTGRRTGIARLHNPIKNVWGAPSMGADIISFNRDSFRSYGKTQGFNAPISEEAMFNYTTALNHLLRKESRQRIQVGDASMVFWAYGKTSLVGFLKDILDPRENTPNLSGLRSFLQAMRDGKRADLPEEQRTTKFFILGLSPNAKRLSIRFWYVSTVGDISKKIGLHFSDLRIMRELEDKQPEYPGIWQLLHVTALRDKTENISPILAGAVMRSILTGMAYPRALLTTVIKRIRAERNIGYFRAALIKAYLTRSNRLSGKKEKEVCMSLDREQKNIGYLLGRIFAVLEKAQKDAGTGKTTIKDRFYGSASSTPAVVFPQLLRLAQHHLQKSAYAGFIEKMIEEITADVQAFPPHLCLEDQGMFALGYYHQKPEMYKKTDKKEEE